MSVKTVALCTVLGLGAGIISEKIGEKTGEFKQKLDDANTVQTLENSRQTFEFQGKHITCPSISDAAKTPHSKDTELRQILDLNNGTCTVKFAPQ